MKHASCRSNRQVYKQVQWRKDDKLVHLSSSRNKKNTSSFFSTTSGLKMTSKPDVPPFIGYVEPTNALQVHLSFSIKVGFLKFLVSKRPSKPTSCKSIGSDASASHSDQPRTRESIYRTHQSLPGSNGRPPPPSPSPADTTGESRTHTVLQGTISALKLLQQIVGLTPVPGLYSLIGVVLNISEVVNASFGATYISQWHVKY